MRPLALVVALATAAPTLAAQPPSPPPAPGQLVRVQLGREAPPQLAGYRGTGTLERLDADSLVVRSGGALVALPLGVVGRLEVHRGRRSRLASLAVGTLAGVAGGALVGASIGSTVGDDDDFFGPSFPEALGGLAGGILGGVGGIVWGSTRSLDRWERVPLSPALRVGARSVALSLAF